MIAIILGLLLFVPDTTFAAQTSADELWKKADELEIAGSYDKAIALYRRIIREHPQEIREDEIQSMKYSYLAQDRIDVVSCRKRRQDVHTQAVNAISLTVKGAVAKGDTKRLSALASCDFDVGPLESDNIFSITPEQFVPPLLKNLHDLDFVSIDSHGMGDNFWIMEISNTKRSERHGFIFRKLEKGWTWTSFATSSGTLLQILYEAKREARK